MAQKKRKTREQKIKSQEKKERAATFTVKEEWLKARKKKAHPSQEIYNLSTKYLKSDLTKTFVLTMLVLAVELALWLYLSRQ